MEGPHFELEFLPGLEAFARLELASLGATDMRLESPEALRFSFAGDEGKLLALRRAVAVYQALSFEVPRPKALLGDQHFRRLVAAVSEVRALHPEDAFEGFRFAAAGSGSTVFARLAEALAKATGLRHDADAGEVLLRVKPGATGWEVLIRLSPRPLSARPWRVCNLSGGINATLAAVMNDLAEPKPGERYLNAMCGSGTLLAEGALEHERAELVGFDLSEEALECAHANLHAAGVLERVTLLKADARKLPFADGSFAAITADLPWGDAVGSHAANAELYPAFLREAARIAAPGARLVVLTHDLKLFGRMLDASTAWCATAEHRVYHGGHHPRLYRLARLPA